jgi:hypothetical protein
LERIPFRFALGKAFPTQHIRQHVIRRANQRVPKSDLFNTVFIEKSERGIGESVVKRRQPTRNAMINSYFDNHLFLLIGFIGMTTLSIACAQ